jgi:serine/threonine protein kinase
MNLNPQDAQRLAAVLLGGPDAEDEGEAAGGGRLSPGPFGRYCITRLVGLGGMGEVYEAQQETPNRRVAIKVVRPDLISGETLRRFEHETRVLAKLQHPGISPIYEAGTHRDRFGEHAIFRDGVCRWAAADGLRRGEKLPVRARLELFLQVCDAVEHAHQKGVIHRDLKPANILVDAAGRPRVMDFGVARATDADIRATSMHTEVGRLVGTLPYMSPEQVGGWRGRRGRCGGTGHAERCVLAGGGAV